MWNGLLRWDQLFPKNLFEFLFFIFKMEWLVKLATIKPFGNVLLKISASCIYLRFLDSSKNHISWSISYLKHNSYAGNNLTTGAIFCCLLVLQGYAQLKHRAFIKSSFLWESKKYCDFEKYNQHLQKKPIWPKFVDIPQPKIQLKQVYSHCHPTIYQKPLPFKIKIHETNLINIIFNNNHHFQSLDP